MKIGLVGYQGCGKSSLFTWLTGVQADPALGHTLQAATVPVPDERVDRLCEIYHPKKITCASLELVDTPGLDRKQEGNAQRLSLIREAGCLVLVVPAWDRDDPLADLGRFEDDLLLADLAIVSGRVERLRESTKKPRPNRDQELAELAALEPLLAAMEEGKRIPKEEMNDDLLKATRAFRLFVEKPRLLLLNTADDETDPARFFGDRKIGFPWIAAPVSLQMEFAGMAPEERDELAAEMGLTVLDRGELLRQIMDASGQFLYFTAGEKEVRSWMLHKGGTALEAADNIHTDLARGFIRAETFGCEDMFRTGSERELKAAGLMRQEPKDYRVADGDVINIRFSV